MMSRRLGAALAGAVVVAISALFAGAPAFADSELGVVSFYIESGGDYSRCLERVRGKLANATLRMGVIKVRVPAKLQPQYNHGYGFSTQDHWFYVYCFPGKKPGTSDIIAMSTSSTFEKAKGGAKALGQILTAK